MSKLEHKNAEDTTKNKADTENTAQNTQDKEDIEAEYAKQRAERGYSDRDLWDIDCWFISTMRPMLIQFKETRTGSPAYLGKNYTNEKGFTVNDTCHQEWDQILDRMIFLLGEMDDSTRTVKNNYEEEYNKAFREFAKKYGAFGEGLETKNEEKDLGSKCFHKIHFMDELPEYKEIHDNYMSERSRIAQYQERCKNEFFILFSEHFYSLWD